MSLISALIFSHSSLAQGPGESFHPMTASGANGVAIFGHTLIWKNPSGTVYNEVYFSSDSSLVASLDTSARIVNGYPSSTSNSIELTMIALDYFTKYYWRVVEYDSTDFTEGPIWYFTSRVNPTEQPYFFDDFETGSGNWDITNDGGTCVWEVRDINTNFYTMPPEAMLNIMAADADNCGSGTTTLSTATLSSMISSEGFGVIKIEWDNDWRIIDAEDEAYVEGSGDGGNSWEIIWSRIGVSERNSHEDDFFFNPTGNTLFRFRTIQPGWDWWWAIDNVLITLIGPLTPMLPPNYLVVFADTTQQRVLIDWDPGFSPDPIYGYKLQRKNGLPADSTVYVTIIETDANTFSYSDYNVQLNQDYTYRIQTLSGPGPSGSIWGNEATAYVPKVIPVELTSFTASISGNDVYLNWSTATELNNSGFNIEKRQTSDVKQNRSWKEISFVPGHGTTTEQQQYSFIDESVSSGKYQYRLKQIDYDGTFEYSDIVEVEVGLPNEFRLEQNYPNPFNPSTTIKYNIIEEGFVSIKIYNTLGSEVAALVEEVKPAGSYIANFNASDLSSGVYFYQLKVGKFVQTKKMLMLK